MTDLNEMAKMHSAGAIIRHISPFDSLPSHRNKEILSNEFAGKWISPFYMTIGNPIRTEWIEEIKKIKNEISEEIILSLLGDFNWRTRLVGSYFSAVKNYELATDIIGTHLLKSELCCVGHIYALTLAFFNTRQSINYLDLYLDYYLSKPKLPFDQKKVLIARIFLNKINNDITNSHLSHWEKYLTVCELLEDQTEPEMKKFYESKNLPWLEEEINNRKIKRRLQIRDLSLSNFEKQIAILHSINQF